jgi:hypothetical protein
MFFDVSEKSINPIFKTQAVREKYRATDGSIILQGMLWEEIGCLGGK